MQKNCFRLLINTMSELRSQRKKTKAKFISRIDNIINDAIVDDSTKDVLLELRENALLLRPKYFGKDFKIYLPRKYMSINNYHKVLEDFKNKYSPAIRTDNLKRLLKQM